MYSIIIVTGSSYTDLVSISCCIALFSVILIFGFLGYPVLYSDAVGMRSDGGCFVLVASVSVVCV